VVALFVLLPSIAQAWWNPEWTARRKITLDTSAAGANLAAAASNVPVLIRLHTGNFPFADADMDGKDLRFVDGDDKTPLKFHVELFDGVNELALVWVLVPNLAPNANTNAIWVYYGNEKAAPASDGKSTYDGSQTAVVHFADKDAAFKDSSAYGHTPAVSGVAYGPTGLADGAGIFNGASRLVWSGQPGLKLSSSGFTFSAWVKAADAAQSALLYSHQEGTSGVQVVYEQGRIFARAFGQETAKIDLAPGAWRHVAVTLSDRLTLYVDGKEAGSANAKAADLGGDVVVGTNFKGELDELQFSNAARPAAWLQAQAASQGEGAKLVSVAAEGESPDAEGGASYFTILLGAVTLDGWIVIGILMVMMLVSFWVMLAKGVFLVRTDGANKNFLTRFQGLSEDLTQLEQGDRKLAGSSIFRLYQIGMRELHHRFELYEQRKMERSLTPQAIDAIRASLDAGIVRENARLNSQMVLLTIAISGGPFLGLLGTVVGVMITFAAIAAVGDVNVNSIAPGIAAALVATVAGLGVAIPALFGYNYLAARVKNIVADQQVFADELIAKIAENYSS
jgi:biopolymer transport protein ExbB